MAHTAKTTNPIDSVEKLIDSFSEIIGRTQRNISRAETIQAFKDAMNNWEGYFLEDKEAAVQKAERGEGR